MERGTHAGKGGSPINNPNATSQALQYTCWLMLPARRWLRGPLIASNKTHQPVEAVASKLLKSQGKEKILRKLKHQ